MDRLQADKRTPTATNSSTMAQFITDLEVSLNPAEEQQLQARSFKKINVDLKQEEGENPIYIWYKTGSSGPIGRVQFTFSDDMAVGLTETGFVKIPKDLSAGEGGPRIYLWFLRSPTDVPIVEIDITTNPKDEASKFTLGWERSACNLNCFFFGPRVHVWVKRQERTFVSEVAVTDSFGSDAELFKKGFIRVDEDLNRYTGGPPVFMWYLLSPSTQQALNSLGISTNEEEYQSLQQQGYKSVSVDLNEGTEGPPVFLWFKQDDVNPPVRAVSVLVFTAVDPFKKAGVQVVERDLNTGTTGSIEYLCFYQ